MIGGSHIKHTRRKQIQNPTNHAITVVIEPYGDVLSLQAGESLEVVAEGRRPGEFETVNDDPGVVTIYTWPSSTCVVYQAEKVVADYSIPVPDVPDGSTTRSFVDLLFRPNEIKE
jgi:hypothetical protein